MAPRRPEKKSKKKGSMSRAAGGSGVTPAVLVKAAEFQLQEGNAPEAASLAKQALDGSSGKDQDALTALNFLGQVSLELGDFDTARTYFMRAVTLDPEGAADEAVGGGPEKFLSLAQLSEDGGQDSVRWFEKGAAALKAQIQSIEDDPVRRKKQQAASSKPNNEEEEDETELRLDELRKKLAMTLCSVAEVYMTDLSWEADAEARCEALTTEATLVAPDFAETWQTLANVRISQSRPEDAQAALTRSLALWRDLPTEDPSVPDFPSRVALARLLMEVEMDTDALEVLERLVAEDDHSVEVWYLGGWGLYVAGEKQRGKRKEAKTDGEGGEDDWKASWISSRVWLNQCLHLYKLQDYEDERLGEHARELLTNIAKELGEAPAEEAEEEEVWVDGSSDEEMQE